MTAAGVAPDRWRAMRNAAVRYFLALGGALLVSGTLVAVTGGSWHRALDALLQGAFLAPGRWGDTLTIATPMLLVALGMVIGVRAGLFNIGQEGQLAMGAMAMSFVGTRFDAPGPLLIFVGLLMGSLVGGGYAGIAAAMRYRRSVPEVISTLLLVFVALQIVGLAVTTDWLLRDPDPARPSGVVTSAALPDGVRLPEVTLFGNEFDIGLILAVGLCLIMSFVLARTVWGFRLRLLGHSPRLAATTGITAARRGSMAFMLSGGLAGLAGAVMLAGGASSYRLTTGFATNIGWQGLLVALLARSHPLACIPMAVLFAALRTGSGYLAATGVDRRIVDVVQALLVLALLIPPALAAWRARTVAVRAAGQDTTDG